MPRQLRIREFKSRKFWEGYQILEERRWWGWKTVERIEIPSHTLISQCFYGDTGGWVSPLIVKYGAPGWGGLIPQGGQRKRQVVVERTVENDGLWLE